MKKSSRLMEVTGVTDLGGRRFRLRLKADALHMKAEPGQFFNIAFEDGNPYLPRPFSIYEMHRDTNEISFLIAAVGVGTRRLQSCRPGDTLRLTGPLGNTFPVDPKATHHLHVAGSIGLAPFIELSLAIEKARPGVRQTLIYGARTAAELVDMKFLENYPWKIVGVTDDGTRGRKGRVTDVLKELLGAEGTVVYACGPHPMLDAVRALCGTTPCWLSLEERMACGMGICKGCVIHHDSMEPPLPTVCKSGPIFSARALATMHP
ncbi:MAG: dihydroorotate dehydrogenase electron transfer subunit [Planctomycetota bacterium]